MASLCRDPKPPTELCVWGGAHLKLRHGRADVRQLDYVGVRGLGKGAERGKGVRALLLGAKALGELTENSRGDGDVGPLDRDACGIRELFDDRKQRVCRQCRSFIRDGVNDLCGAHRDKCMRTEGSSAFLETVDDDSLEQLTERRGTRLCREYPKSPTLRAG